MSDSVSIALGEGVTGLLTRYAGSMVIDGHHLVLLPTVEGWPLHITVDGAAATIVSALGARLRIGRDSDGGPLLDVIEAFLAGDAEVSVVRRADGSVGPLAWRVWWGRNELANAVDPDDVILATLRAPSWSGATGN